MSVTSEVAPDGIMGAAITTVIDQMDKLDVISSRYRRELSDSLSNIEQVTVTQIDAPPRMEAPQTPVPNINLSDAPKFSPIQMNKPRLPVFQSIDNLLSELNLDDLNMPDAPVMPTIELPSTPGMINIPVPERPVVNTDIDIPEAPVL
ncbi:MAG: hypothetical protein JHC54_05825, partial [Acinetobacter sp.]|nr:hypothetical protein [Acinetobacter sp.]